MSDLFNSDDNSGTSSVKYENWEKEALITKALNADAHIKLLETEAAQRRQLEDTNETLEEILAKLDNTKQPSLFQAPDNQPNPGGNPPLNSDSVSKNDVLAMVASAIENNQKKTLAQTNVAKVQDSLSKQWGPDFKKKLADKTKELNVSQDLLATMAESYPDAFLKLVSDPTPGNPNPHLPPFSSKFVSSDSKPMSKWKDFSKAMKDNPRLREDHSFQRNLHATAEALGDSFWN